MDYTKFKFLFPPRAESKSSHTLLGSYDTAEWVAQVKYNGSCCAVFIDPETVKVINRHGEDKTRVSQHIDFRGIYSGTGWMVVCGELMDKSKKGEDGESITGFIIWDILVYNGVYLVGTSLCERLLIMEKLWPCQRMVVSDKGLKGFEFLCHTNAKGIFKTTTYMGGNNSFASIYDDVTKIDAYEGLVIKKANSTLEYGFQEKNNTGWQVKFRKPTRNYKT